MVFSIRHAITLPIIGLLLIVLGVVVPPASARAQSGNVTGTYSGAYDDTSAGAKWNMRLTVEKRGALYSLTGVYSIDTGKQGNTKSKPAYHSFHGSFSPKTGKFKGTTSLAGRSDLPVDGTYNASSRSFEISMTPTAGIGTINVLCKRQGTSAGHKPVPDEPIWIADPPVINKGDSSSVSASAENITVTIEQDGKKGSGTLTWSGIPKRVKLGERVILKMNAQASSPGRILGWFNQDCAGKMYENDNNAASWPEGKRTGREYNAGVMEFDFKEGTYIQVSGGVDPPGIWATITWKFHRAKPGE